MESNKPENNSAIFGGAKPVDTAAKEREIDERLQKQQSNEPKNANNRSRTTSERSSESSEPPAPSTGSIFGQARPVDTTKREREIEEKLKKTDLNSEKRDDNTVRKSYDRKSENSGTISPNQVDGKRSKSPPPMKKVEESKPPVRQLSINFD